MTKNQYFQFLTGTYVLISISNIYGLIFKDSLFGDFLNITMLKTLSILLVIFGTWSFAKSKISGAVGYLAVPTTLIGFLFKIMHWPFAGLLMFIGGVSLLIMLISAIIFERDQPLFYLAAPIYVLLRLSIIVLNLYDDIYWWLDILVCLIVALIGLKEIVPKLFKRT